MRLHPFSRSLGRSASTIVFSMLIAFGYSAGQAATINEVRIDNPGADTDEYFELAGTPGESLTGLTYIVIGDGATGSGTIENVTDLTGFSIQADGYFAAHKSGTIGTCTGYDAEVSLNFENSDNVTHLLVRGFTGLDGQDLDTNDDGVLDVTPWTQIVDSIALIETVGTGDLVYSTTQIGPDGPFVPGHVFFCTDTWLIGSFDACVDDTPGAENVCQVGPDVFDVYRRPLWVEPGEAVTVTATATDQDGIVASANVFYRVNGGSFVQAAMANVGGDQWEGTIPAGVLNDVVDYYVEATDDNGLSRTSPIEGAANPFTYVIENEVITPIATIQANPVAFVDSLVIVQGQVYCPGDYRADGSVTAYIQDGSGRGINIFGTTRSTGFADLNDTGNIVKVTGFGDLFFTTTEIINYEVELISAGNPPLSPSVQSTGDAAMASNEGTYVETTGVINAIQDAASAGGAWNFTINDTSGNVVIRVDDDLRPDLGTAFSIGDGITARGAGSTFNMQGQILVCSGADIVNNGPVGDNLPPVLESASLTTATSVTLQFDESIDPVTGGTASNYLVFEDGAPGTTVGVVTATVGIDDTQVLLTLAASISGVQHRVRVNNVEDLNNNVIAADSETLIADPSIAPLIVINEIMQNPFFLSDTVGEWFEVYNAGPTAVDMNGWTIRDDGTNAHVIDNGGPLVINPGEYQVFVRDSATMTLEGVTPFYQYAGISLGNSADQVILEDALSVLVDRVDYDGGPLWPDPNGHSMQYGGTGDNNDPANWSAMGAPAFGSGDRGTPGAPNDFVTPAPVPLLTELRQNHPNPFNPSTSFSFSLERTGRVTLEVFNLRGQRVRTVLDEVLEAGSHAGIEWDGTDDSGRRVTSGAYFYRLVTEDGKKLTRKMMLVK